VRRRLAWIAALCFAAVAPAAHAAAPIEGTWAFQGGRVLVESTDSDGFRGTVTRATTAGPCSHRVSQPIWEVNATEQTGIYRGGAIYLDGSCKTLPGRGFARWTITGDRGLELCSVAPDDVSSAPTCVDLQRVRAPAAAPTFATTVVVPASSTCRRSRKLRVTVRRGAPDPPIRAVISVDGRRRKTVSAPKLTKPIEVAGLPRGSYRISVTVRTATGRLLRGSSRYRTC
jgi:mRNA-degrading endonuclease toxin of MazEF toxin-antitoxin module